MSYQASTEKCFNKMFDDFKKGILPQVIQNWDQIPVDNHVLATLEFSIFIVDYTAS